MSHTRTAVLAAIAALALGGSTVAATIPAHAHTYTKEGTVSAKEAGKLFKQAFKQRCLTMHEAQHIARGSGYENWNEYDEVVLVFDGTKKSHISQIQLSISESSGCVTDVTAYKRN